MFCFQCSDALAGKGCTKIGVCGKKPEVAKMQDLLIYSTKGLAAVATQLRAEGQVVKPRVNHVVALNLFMTITNANFDREEIIQRIEQTLRTKARLLAVVNDKKNLRFGRTNEQTLTLKPKPSESWRRRTRIFAAFAS